MKVKITKLAWKFAVKSDKAKKFSGIYQKKGMPSASYIWQSLYLPRFYAIFKLQA